jgi:hypothetical protein
MEHLHFTVGRLVDEKFVVQQETTLSTGNLIAFWGQKLTNPPTPGGGTWSVDVYNTDGVILYSTK